MKTRMLKRLRRMAKTRVFAQWDGFCFTIVWKKWRSVDEGYIMLEYERAHNASDNDGFRLMGGTSYNTIDELKPALVDARRCVIMEMVNEQKDEMIRKKIQNL